MNTRKSLLLAIQLLAAALAGGFGPPARAQVNPNLNEIRGTMRLLTPSGPLLDYFTAGGARFVDTYLDPSGGGVGVRAQAVLPDTDSGAQHNPTLGGPLAAWEAGYIVSLQTRLGGILYNLKGTIELQDNQSSENGAHDGAYYFDFPQRLAPDRLYPPPANSLAVDLEECGSLIEVRLEDSGPAHAPLAVNYLDITARMLSGPAGYNRTRTKDGVPNLTGTTLLVRGGAVYQLTITVRVGTDGNHDTRTWRTEPALLTSGLTAEFPNGIAECNQRHVIVIRPPIGDGGTLGRIVGQIDMKGRSGLSYSVEAGGPLGNGRNYQGPPGFQTWGYELENLVPSSASEPPLGYQIGRYMDFDTTLGVNGGSTPPFIRERFVFPPTSEAPGTPNGRTLVNSGETVDVGNLLVFCPGKVFGKVFLQGPSTPPFYLNKMNYVETAAGGVYDEKPDGFPDVAFTGGAAGRMNTSINGFNAATHSYEVPYELWLGNLREAPGRWNNNNLNADLRDVATPENPESYIACHWELVQDGRKLDVFPGQSYQQDWRCCVGNVRINFNSVNSEMIFAPEFVAIVGELNGPNFENLPTHYTVGRARASGTPVDYEHRAAVGRVNLCLPEGLYRLYPKFQAVASDGSIGTINPASFPVRVVCGAHIERTPNLGVNLDTYPSHCPSEQPGRFAGTVQSVRNVTRLSYSVTVNGQPGPEAVLCENCGVSPAFSFVVPLNVCEPSIRITAEDELGERASVELTVHPAGYEPPKDVAVVIDPIYDAPMRSPCCGRPMHYLITYVNLVKDPVNNVQVQLDLSRHILFTSATLLPSDIHPADQNNQHCTGAGGTFYWNLGTLPGNAWGQILVSGVMCPCPGGENGGCNAQVSYQPEVVTKVSITPFPDDKPQNNKDWSKVKAKCSCDPNDLQVTPHGCGPEGLISRDTTLTYQIQFQNLGSAPAYRVILRNTLDADLDLSTLELLGSSHLSNRFEIQGRELVWTFNDIELPAAIDDEPASHGYVRYRVRPRADAPVGTAITNQAGIYFDLNAPVITVATTNTITEDPLPVAAFTASPQPASEGRAYDFTYTGGTSGATFRWDFGPAAVPTTSTNQNPSGVLFPGSGPTVVTLEVSLGDCTVEAEARVIVIGPPALQAARQRHQVFLWWDGEGFALEETDELSNPSAWRPTTGAASYVAGTFYVTVPLATGHKFYRLRGR